MLSLTQATYPANPQSPAPATLSFDTLLAGSMPSPDVKSAAPVVQPVAVNSQPGTKAAGSLPDNIQNVAHIGSFEEPLNPETKSTKTGVVISSSVSPSDLIQLPELPPGDSAPKATELAPPTPQIMPQHLVVSSPQLPGVRSKSGQSVSPSDLIQLPELPPGNSAPKATEFAPPTPQIMPQHLVVSSPQMPGVRSKSGQPAELTPVKISTGSAVRTDKPNTDTAPADKRFIASNNFVHPSVAIPVSVAEVPLLNQLPFANPTAAFATLTPQLDLARDLAWIGNLAQEIVAASESNDRLTFRLMPQSLGRLDVEMVHLPDGLQVEMTATTERAAQIIAAEQPRLVEELRQSGVRMAPADQTMFQQGGSQRQPHQRQELPFASTTPKTQATDTPNRPGGRFA